MSPREALPLLALMAAAGCRSPQRGPEVIVYASVDQVYAEPLLAEFAQSSGIRVLPVFDVEAAKTTGLANRIIAERRRPRADVFWNGEFTQTLRLNREGLLANYRSPEAGELPAGYRDPAGAWAANGARCRVLLSNTRLLPGGPPRPSIEALLHPAVPAHQRGMSYPMFGTSATHAAALYASRGPAGALAFFQSVRAAGVRVVDGNSVVRDLVAQGHLALGLTDSDDACGALGRGAPVRIDLPDGDAAGTPVIPATVALVAGGPNPQSARRLVDFLLSAAAERRLMQAGFFQFSVRNLREPGGCLAGRAFRPLDVAPERVFSYLDASRAAMEKIFVR